MANEIKLTASLDYTPAGGDAVSGSCNKTLDITGTEGFFENISVGFAADQAIDIADLANIGQLFVKNYDTSNFVQISTATGGGFAAAVIAKIRAGCCCLFQPNTSTLYIKADTGACKCLVGAVEI